MKLISSLNRMVVVLRIKQLSQLRQLNPPSNTIPGAGRGVSGLAVRLPDDAVANAADGAV